MLRTAREFIEAYFTLRYLQEKGYMEKDNLSFLEFLGLYKQGLKRLKEEKDAD